MKVIGATDDDGIYYDFVSMESDFYGCMSADAVVRRKPLPQEE